MYYYRIEQKGAKARCVVNIFCIQKGKLEAEILEIHALGISFF